jgi:hypothetical protein
MLKFIISPLTVLLIKFLPNKFRHLSLFGYTFGIPVPDFPGLPPDFVPLSQDSELCPKVIYNDAGIPTGLRITSGDGLWFEAFTKKYEVLENRHFDSFETFHFYHDQV